MFTRRFLNLLQGRLAVTKREVCALELASLCGDESGEVVGQDRGAGVSATRSLTHLFYLLCACGGQRTTVGVNFHGHPFSMASQSP